MAFNKVDTNIIGGGTGRPIQGYDHYSGLSFLGTAPTVTGKWNPYNGDTTIKAQQIFSVQDAEDCGILPWTDNVSASGTYLITTAGATGDTINLSIPVPIANGLIETVNFGTYTKLVSDSSIALLGASLTAMINTGTINHGFTATFNTATITVVGPKFYGVSLNGVTITATIVGTIAGTSGAFANGTASQYAAWHYQISEYFRIFGEGGNIWIGIRATSDSFKELCVLQSAAQNQLRQIGVYEIDATRSSAANITGTILSINSAASLKDETSPFEVVYSPNIKAVTDLSTYPNQNLNTSSKVQCVISQDGKAAGALLYVRLGQSVGNVGAKLASIAKSRLSASDAQPIDSFNMSDGVENNTPAFANGSLSENVATSLQVQLNDYNYTFFIQVTDVKVGSYWNDNKTCITRESDFCNVNDNRTINAVRRLCRVALIPELNSELYFNTDGTLQDYTVEFFQSKVEDSVTSYMITGKGSTPYISGISCLIDPTQPVKQTGNLILSVGVIQNGIARNITVNIGYRQSL